MIQLSPLESFREGSSDIFEAGVVDGYYEKPVAKGASRKSRTLHLASADCCSRATIDNIQHGCHH